MKFTLQQPTNPQTSSAAPLELWLDGVKLPVGIGGLFNIGDHYGPYLELKLYLEHVDFAGPGYEMPPREQSLSLKDKITGEKHPAPDTLNTPCTASEFFRDHAVGGSPIKKLETQWNEIIASRQNTMAIQQMPEYLDGLRMKIRANGDEPCA